jgi:hypothetical protein
LKIPFFKKSKTFQNILHFLSQSSLEEKHFLKISTFIKEFQIKSPENLQITVSYLFIYSFWLFNFAMIWAGPFYLWVVSKGLLIKKTGKTLFV